MPWWSYVLAAAGGGGIGIAGMLLLAWLLRRRKERHMRVRVGNGDTYQLGDDVDLIEAAPDPDPPPAELRGEPWGWTKGAPYPRGWREDGDYGPR